MDMTEASAVHPSDDKKKPKRRESTSTVGGARRSEPRQRADPLHQQTAEQQELDVLRQELQVQLQYRVRKACLWASAALLRLGTAASSLAYRLEEWTVAHSLARQEVIAALARRLKEAIEAEQRIKETLSLKGQKRSAFRWQSSVCSVLQTPRRLYRKPQNESPTGGPLQPTLAASVL